MESRAAKEEGDKQAEIRRQIAALQAQLQTEAPLPPPTPPKQKHVIAPGTPSPEKRKLDTKSQAERPKCAPPQLKPKLPCADPVDAPPLKPSSLLSNLATLHARSRVTVEPITRSTGFSQAPPERSAVLPALQERDDRLALVEKLVPGGKDHPPPTDDPHFERLEPNSGIHLISRKLAHADLQEYLSERYYLSPSLLYSVIRPLPSNQGYDVPVPGDWLTIAVIAERGPIKMTATSSTANHDDEEIGSNNTQKGGKEKQKTKAEDKSSRAKKYMSLKLVDFGTRSRASSSTPPAQIRGDALLTLLLFEADSFSYIEDENKPKTSKAERVKIYKGGSGGAFEACMKLHEGAVIAILNPKILKPYQRNATAPHPTTNILAITPTSAESIAIIGRSRDLGMCGATKRDGKVCGSWCDKRVADCCEYHVEHAVQRKRAGRAEFSIGTSGMTATAQPRKVPYDPDRKWGLLPAADAGPSRGNSHEAASTYVIPGHVISASGPEYVDEKIGRGREERAKRRREEKKTDEILNRLLGRDGGGGGDRNAAAGAVRKAREVMQSLKDGKAKKKKGKDEDKVEERRKSAYSAETIKRLGFDPAAKAAQSDSAADTVLKRKLDVLASLQDNRGDVALGPRPGKRIRSGVSVPDDARSAPGLGDEAKVGERTVTSVVLSDSDDDLEIEYPA